MPLGTSPPILPPDNDLRVYGLFRERIVQEDVIIYHRMTYMLWSTAILLALWGALAAQKFTNSACVHGQYQILPFLMSIIEVLGLSVIVGSIFSIGAARSEIQRIKEIYRDKYPHILNNQSIPSLTGADKYHVLGHIVDTYFPYTLAIMWCGFAYLVFTTC